MTDERLPLRALLVVAATSVLVLVGAAGLVFALLQHWRLPAGGQHGSAALVAPIPAPRLQTAPQREGSAAARGRVAPSGDADDVPAFHQRLGAALPRDIQLVNADGRVLDRAALRRDGRPIVLVPAFFRCDTLCGIVAHGAIEALADTGLPADDWRLLIVSVDPHDTPADARALRSVYARYAGWARPAVFHGHENIELLTGDVKATHAVVRTIGFDAIERGDAGGGAFNVAHATGIVVLTPGGTISRYLFGVRFDPRQLRLALVAASDERIGSFADQLVLACAHVDPSLGRHDGAVLYTLRVLGVLMTLGLAALFWRHRQRRRAR